MSNYEEELNNIFRETLLVMNKNIEAIQYHIIENQLEFNLLQEASLYYYSSLFDTPTFFMVLTFLIVGTRSTRTFPSADNCSFTNNHYWTIHHPYIADDDNPRTSFRAMFRINRSSFERLVNDLSQYPAFDLRTRNSVPVYIQISCAIWRRLANCYLGYRTSNTAHAFGVSPGSYMYFFRRTLAAIVEVYGNNIS